eukprot:6180400-Pleurochrysis_carterae.AAC.7
MLQAFGVKHYQGMYSFASKLYHLDFRAPTPADRCSHQCQYFLTVRHVKVQVFARPRGAYRGSRGKRGGLEDTRPSRLRARRDAADGRRGKSAKV